jgi:hypothetical protein
MKQSSSNLKIFLYLFLFLVVIYFVFSSRKTEIFISQVLKLETAYEEESVGLKYVDTKINVDILNNDKFKELSPIISKEELALLKSIEESDNKQESVIVEEGITSAEKTDSDGEIDFSKLNIRKSNPFASF